MSDSIRTLHPTQVECACHWRDGAVACRYWCEQTVSSHLRSGERNTWQYCNDCYENECPYCTDYDGKINVRGVGDG